MIEWTWKKAEKERERETVFAVGCLGKSLIILIIRPVASSVPPCLPLSFYNVRVCVTFCQTKGCNRRDLMYKVRSTRAFSFPSIRFRNMQSFPRTSDAPDCSDQPTLDFRRLLFLDFSKRDLQYFKSTLNRSYPVILLKSNLPRNTINSVFEVHIF